MKRQNILRAPIYFCVLFTSCVTIGDARGQVPEHFPYTFSNFVWWSDSELRAELKMRIPSLPGELTRNSPTEARVRASLVQLLNQKGIHADVQVREPDADVASHHFVPEAPRPSIVFSIVAPPEILLGKFVFRGAPTEVANALETESQALQGRPYSVNRFWADQSNLKQILEQNGYLSASLALTPGIPSKNGENYLVPINAEIQSGPLYHVSSVKASGGPLAQDRDLLQFFSLKPGDVAKPDAFGRLAGALRSVYWKAGYSDVEFKVAPVLDQAHALASYQFEVVPGPQYRLRSLKMLNVDDAQQAQVRSILGIKPGDIYDGMAVQRLSQTLRQPTSPLPSFDFSYNAKEDTAEHVVDLTLDFYKRTP